MAINKFLNHRRVGGKLRKRHQSDAVCKLLKSRDITRRETYAFESERVPWLFGDLALDSSGHVLLFGAMKTAYGWRQSQYTDVGDPHVGTINISQHSGVTESGQSVKYNDFRLNDSYLLRRVQWIPNGNSKYSSCVTNYLRVHDVQQDEVIFELPLVESGRFSWSDWQPTDTNVMAVTAGGCKFVFDLREDQSRAMTMQLATNSEYEVSCFSWSNWNDNQLILSEHKHSITLYDKRYQTRTMELVTNIRGGCSGGLQMSPNGKYLFFHECETNNLLQMEYDGVTCRTIRQYAGLKCEKSRPALRHSNLRFIVDHENRDARCQFHLTDRLVFIPLTEPEILPHSETKKTVHVFDIETGELVNWIESHKHDVDVAAIVGSKDHLNQLDLYTLKVKSKLTSTPVIDKWSLCLDSQEDAKKLSMLSRRYDDNRQNVRPLRLAQPNR